MATCLGVKENLERRIVIITTGARSENGYLQSTMPFSTFSTRLSPFLDEKPKKKEEVNVLGDQERKVEQKKVDR